MTRIPASHNPRNFRRSRTAIACALFLAMDTSGSVARTVPMRRWTRIDDASRTGSDWRGMSQPSAATGQPVSSEAAALDIASAHLHAQARQDAFARLAARDGLMVDAEPERLGVELVNRYHAAKRAGMI